MSVEATQHETRNRKVRHTQEETTQWTSVRLAKARANKANASTARAKAKGSKDSMDSKDNEDETGVRTRTRTRIRLNVGIVERAGHYSKGCWSKKNTNEGGSKGKHKSKNAAGAHNLDSTKPANSEPEVEIGEFEMDNLDVDTVEVQGSEWIKIGVDTGAGKTAWPQSVIYGKKLRGHVDLTFRTATGELVKSGTLKVAAIGESISEFEVFKRRCVNHCCLLENSRRWVESLSCMVTKVTCSTRVRMSRRKSMRGSRRR